jgi:uncharacterized protein
MKIGVISDTHISLNLDGRYLLHKSINNPEALYKAIEPYFKNAKAVIHAGDITDMSVIKMLERFGEVYLVAGNMDPTSVHVNYGDKKIIEISGFRIGIIHGWGAPEGLSLKVRQEFAPGSVDCIVFGHTHHPYNKIEDDVLMFNPGSATEKRFSPNLAIGILHIGNELRGEHVFLD